MYDYRVRETSPVVGEVRLHRPFGAPFVSVLVRYGLIEHRQRVHASALDLPDECVDGIQIVVYPKAAGEQYAYGHLLRIQGGEVLFPRYVPVHVRMVISVAPLLDGFRRLYIRKAHDVRYVVHDGVIVVRASGGRISGYGGILLIGTSEQRPLHQRDLRVPAVDQHVSLGLFEYRFQLLEPLEAVGIGHAAHEEEIRLLGLPDQFLEFQHVVVGVLAVQCVNHRLYSQIAEPFGRLGHITGVRGLGGHKNDAHLRWI